MIQWLREHSLSLVLVLLLAGLAFWNLVLGVELKDIASNLLGDTYGVLLIVIFTKYLWERGSAESK